MPWLERDGHRLHYVDRGEGVAFVFQHGLGGDVLQTETLVPSRRDERRFTLECRGHGRSDLGPPERVGFAQFAEDLRAATEQAGVDEGVVGGISMGAGVACAFAARSRGFRVRGLVLVRPAWPAGPMAEPARTLYSELAAILEHHPDIDQARAEYSRIPAVLEMRSSAPAAHASLLGHFDDKDPRRLEALSRHLPRQIPATERELTSLGVPTLLIFTEQDPIHPQPVAAELCSMLPQASLLEVVSKSERPEEHQAEVQAAVQAFIEEVR